MITKEEVFETAKNLRDMLKTKKYDPEDAKWLGNLLYDMIIELFDSGCSDDFVKPEIASEIINSLINLGYSRSQLGKMAGVSDDTVCAYKEKKHNARRDSVVIWETELRKVTA